MRTGTHAEYVVVDEDGTVGAKPEKLSMIESVSLVFGGLTAQSFLLGRASLRAGERVLINGATGSVGSASIQLARHVGAHVTAVCRAQNEGLALSLGAHEVIDYYRHDFAGIGESWDVIMDNVGNVCWRKASHILRPGGRLVLAVADLQTMVGGFLRPHRSGRRVIVGVAEDRRAMLDQLSAMVASNSLAPTVGCVLPFAEVVRAHAYVDTGHKVGSVVLDLSGFA
jgi:NADPH:quinone reductase-like Zn-dependent oxidoreductase